jgi:chorismate mutase
VTLQIDSLDVSSDETSSGAGEIEKLHEQVVALDADILGAIERRSELVRQLAAVTVNDAEQTGSTFDDLGTDGSVLKRMLARIASVAG